MTTSKIVLLEPLVAEARKTKNFDEFEKDFLLQIKHGRYYHITDDPNFRISSGKGPRDMSSMASGAMAPGKLMITSDLEYWAAEYPGRKYVALIDMSQVPRDKYWQVARGFGNEFWVDDPSKAKVVKVMPIDKALKEDEDYNDLLPQSSAQLEAFYNAAKKTSLTHTYKPSPWR